MSRAFKPFLGRHSGEDLSSRTSSELAQQQMANLGFSTPMPSPERSQPPSQCKQAEALYKTPEKRVHSSDSSRNTAFARLNRPSSSEDDKATTLYKPVPHFGNLGALLDAAELATRSASRSESPDKSVMANSGGLRSVNEVLRWPQSLPMDVGPKDLLPPGFGPKTPSPFKALARQRSRVPPSKRLAQAKSCDEELMAPTHSPDSEADPDWQASEDEHVSGDGRRKRKGRKHRRVASVPDNMRHDDSDDSSEDEASDDSQGAAANRAPRWPPARRDALVAAVAASAPRGAEDWERVALQVGCAEGSGAAAERMYRSITDPAYVKSSNKHGKRINPRRGHIPTHLMAAYALGRLPNKEGNLREISKQIEAHPTFAEVLDRNPRPGTKVYARYKDALLGCFKKGRYRHFGRAVEKRDGQIVYNLSPELVPDTVHKALACILAQAPPNPFGRAWGVQPSAAQTTMTDGHQQGEPSSAQPAPMQE